jgi:hypothetical protein
VIDDYAGCPRRRTRRRRARSRRVRRRDAARKRSGAPRSRSAPAAIASTRRRSRRRLHDRGAGRDRVARGDPIVEIHHRGGRGLADARRLLEAPSRSATRRCRRGRSCSTIGVAGNVQGRTLDGTTEPDVTGEIALPAPARAPYERRDFAVVGAAAAAAAVCALAANLLDLPRLQPLTGLIVIMTIAYAFSTNRRAIDRRTVAWGLGLQILFALIVLKTASGSRCSSRWPR